MAVDPQQISLSMNDGEEEYDERLESIPDEGCDPMHLEMKEPSNSIRGSEVSDDQDQIYHCCSKATVLLADDLVFNMIPVEQILTSDYGLKCDKANDGEIMLKMYLDNMEKTCCDVHYRIILTDINMPRMDGIEASERIFAEQRRLRDRYDHLPEVMIVAITAYDNEATVKKLGTVGIRDCLTKPVKPEQLKFILEYHNSLDMNIPEVEQGSSGRKLVPNQVNLI